MTTLQKELDELFRETPPDVDTDYELEDRLDEVEQALTKAQRKALGL
jgi:hypothetical protein